MIRENPRTIAADPHGEAIVRDEILAYAPSEAGAAAARALGFDILRQQSDVDLEWRLVVLRAPPKLSTDKALRKLRAADPEGIYDFNHLYIGSGGLRVAAAERDAAKSEAALSDASGAPTSATAARVGLIDTGVESAHPVFSGTAVHRWSCDDREIPAAHGTVPPGTG